MPLDVGAQPLAEFRECHAPPVGPVEEVALESAEEPLAPRVVRNPGLARHRARRVAGGARRPLVGHVGKAALLAVDELGIQFLRAVARSRFPGDCAGRIGCIAWNREGQLDGIRITHARLHGLEHALLHPRSFTT